MNSCVWDERAVESTRAKVLDARGKYSSGGKSELQFPSRIQLSFSNHERSIVNYLFFTMVVSLGCFSPFHEYLIWYPQVWIWAVLRGIPARENSLDELTGFDEDVEYEFEVNFGSE